MNYEKIYGSLCARGVSRLSGKKGKGMHDHHIVPRSEGGWDTADNIARLTAREHFLAHWLLWKMLPSSFSRAHAFFKMKNTRGFVLNAKTYGMLQAMHSRQASRRLKSLHNDPDFAKEHALRASKICLGRNTDPAHRLKVSEGLKRKYKEDSGYAEKMRTAVENNWSDPDKIARHKIAVLESKKNPDYMARQKAGTAARNKAAFSKPVVAGDGMCFASMTCAKDWLITNGFPKASIAAISRVCLGKNKSAYGRSWSFATKG